MIMGLKTYRPHQQFVATVDKEEGEGKKRHIQDSNSHATEMGKEGTEDPADSWRGSQTERPQITKIHRTSAYMCLSKKREKENWTAGCPWFPWVGAKKRGTHIPRIDVTPFSGDPRRGHNMTTNLRGRSGS